MSLLGVINGIDGVGMSVGVYNGGMNFGNLDSVGMSVGVIDGVVNVDDLEVSK